MSEEEKPKKITVTLTIPTKETIVDSIKKMFPLIEVEIEEEEPAQEETLEEETS